jgi:DNA mismatch repair ATPase MutS
MCGFPLMHLDKYLKILVQQNKRFVSMCEEFPRPSPQERGFDRRVVRIITPGTLIDEPFLNQYENNYLLAISPPTLNSTEPRKENLAGLAWIDVSTGEFFTNCTTYQNLRDEICRIGPREVVIDKTLETDVTHPVRQILSEEGSCVSYTATVEPNFTGCAPYSNVIATADDMSNPSTSAFTLHETSAVNILTTFLLANLLEHMPQLPLPSRETSEGRMQIDAHTVHALEIREGIREGGTSGSLLSVIKRTVTSSGTRLLSRWLGMNIPMWLGIPH